MLLRWGFGVVSCLGVLGGACTDEADTLLSGEADEGPDRFEHLRRRANLTWIVDGTPPTEETVDLFDDDELNLLHNEFVQHCQTVLGGEDQICETTTPCNACTIHKELCAASRLLEIAGIVAEPLRLDTKTIERQPLATRTRLQEVAAEWARDYVVKAAFSNILAMEGLDMGVTCTHTDAATEWGPDDQEQTFARSLVMVLLDGYELIREATDAAVGGHLSLADEYFSTDASDAAAAELAISSRYQSRSRAAHLLVGGANGLGGQLAALTGWAGGTDPNDAERVSLCGREDLSPRGRAALGVLREAAPNPVRVRQEPIEDLLFEPDPVSNEEDGVRARLEQLWGVAWTDDADFLSEFDLDLNDFEEARARLRDEMNAFALSEAQQMPARALATSGAPAETDLDRFAATGRPPRPAPYLHYTSLAGYRAAPADDDIDLFDYAEVGLAQLIDVVLYVASVVVLNADLYEADGLDDDVIDPLALLVGEGRRERPARVVAVDTGTNTWTIDVFHFADYAISPTDLIVVTDVDTLKCATHGDVDGEPCTVDTYYVDSSGPGGGGDGFDENSTFTFSGAELADARFFVLHAKEGPASTPEPGGYDQVAAGWFGDAGTPLWVPAVPLVDEQAAEILTPSQAWCTRSKTTCANTDFDDAIPLEDELSSDSGASVPQDVESSWRHYLDLAKQAAAEADLLGESVINTGLELDMRSEAALEEIEDICGAAIDVDGLVSAEPDGGLGDVHEPGGCMDDEDCTAPATCRLGQCIRDAVQVAQENTDDPESARLVACLGTGTEIDFVTLGTRRLCFWTKPDGSICGGNADDFVDGYDGSFTCPYVALNDSPNVAEACSPTPVIDDPITVGMDEAYVMDLVDTRLGYFDTDAAGPSGYAPSASCDVVRRLRAGSSETTVEQLADTGFFNPARVRTIARRLGWEARIDDFSAITLDGMPWISTGDTTGGPNTVWPCDAPPLPEDPMTPGPDCMTGTGLFCDQVLTSCDDRGARAALNRRFAIAVIAARALTGQGYEGIWVPLVPDPSHYGTPTADLLYASGSITDYADRGIVTGSELRVASTAYPTNVPIRLSCVEDDTDFHAWTAFDVDGDPVTSNASCSTNWPFAVVDYGRGDVVGSGRVDASADGFLVATGLWGGVSDFPIAGNAFAQPHYYNLFTYGPSPTLFSELIPVHGFQSAHVGQCPGGCERGLDPMKVSYPRNRAAIGLAIHNTRFSTATGDFSVYVDGVHNYISLNQALDAMELICEAGQVGGATSACPPEPPLVGNLDGLRDATRYMECLAHDMDRRGAYTLLANFPSGAVDSLRATSVTGAYPAAGGQRGAAIQRLRAALVELSGLPELVASQMRGLAGDMDILRLQLEMSERREEIADIQFMSTVSTQLTQCATSGTEGNPFLVALRVVATCANSIAQINFASQLRRLEELDAEDSASLAVANFSERFNDRTTTLQSLGNQMSQQLEAIDAQLAELEVLRRRAQRALSRAGLTGSGPMSIHRAVNSAMQGRHNLARARYERAHRDAVRMAFLAQRAIEQRLGVRLADLGDDMSLVDAPASWEASICTHEGVDYARLRRDGIDTGDNFVSPFIGDFVRKLELVVESYRLDFPFQAGTDTAVISLRDQIHDVRALCPSDTSNLIYFSGQPDVTANDEDGLPGWENSGCHEYEDEPVRDCVSAVPLDTAPDDEPAPPNAGRAHELAALRGYRVTFGKEGETCPDNETCGLTASTARVQPATLGPGRYRMSWFARQEDGMSPLSVSEVVDVLDGDDDPLLGSRETEPDGTWTRVWAFFELDRQQEVRVAILPDVGGGVDPQGIDLAGLMLEDVTLEVLTATIVPDDHPPRSYIETGAELTRPLALCEDTTGSEFRSRVWRRNCIRLCSEGFGRGCESGGGERHCYMETEFVITQRDIERGRLFRSTGFARGNYNYRIESLGLNFVGSTTRDCSTSESPSTCYSAGWVPFSLDHLGPYTVRNHRGEDFDARLFSGHIEHARGLAAERYLTNPLSSADRSVIDPYVRHEFRGRPLDGVYVLRVWDDPGVNFQGIDDVQIVLNYRYWTRFGE